MPYARERTKAILLRDPRCLIAANNPIQAVSLTAVEMAMRFWLCLSVVFVAAVAVGTRAKNASAP